MSITSSDEQGNIKQLIGGDNQDYWIGFSDEVRVCSLLLTIHLQTLL